MSSNEWKRYIFSDFVTINPPVKLDRSKEYSFVEMKDLNENNKFVFPSAKRKLSGGSRFQNNDTLFARITPCLENGKICQVKDLHDNVGFGSTEFLVFRGKDGVSDNEFVFYLSRSELVRRHAEQNMHGTSGRQRVPKEVFDNLELELPSLETQRRIADILSALDEKIELNRQTNATLEAIAQSIFREWFVEFNYPDPKGLSREQAPSEAMESGVNGSRQAGQTFRVSDMVESELGMIPQGWRVGKLGDVVEVKGGTTPSTKEEKYWNGEYYFATPKDLSNLGSPILLDTERKITKEGVSQISSGILPKGTLLLSSRAPIGYLAISNIPVSINQGFIAINAKETSNLFILHWLKENMETVISRANGSTFLEITKTNFKQIEIVIPDSEITNRFEEIVSPIFEKIKNNEQQSATLASLRDALLPKLMSGEIEV